MVGPPFDERLHYLQRNIGSGPGARIIAFAEAGFAQLKSIAAAWRSAISAEEVLFCCLGRRFLSGARPDLIHSHHEQEDGKHPGRLRLGRGGPRFCP